MDPRWPEEVLKALQENTLSMLAGEGIGAVVFTDEMATLLPNLTHLYVFTDSTAVEAAINSASSPSPQMNVVVSWLFDRILGTQECSSWRFTSRARGITQATVSAAAGRSRF